MSFQMMKYVCPHWFTELLAPVFTMGFTLIELNLSIKLYFNIQQVLYPSKIPSQPPCRFHSHASSSESKGLWTLWKGDLEQCSITVKRVISHPEPSLPAQTQTPLYFSRTGHQLNCWHFSLALIQHWFCNQSTVPNYKKLFFKELGKLPHDKKKKK